MKQILHIIVIISSLISPFLLAGCGKQPPLYSEPTVKDKMIVIPTESVSDGKAHFYTYKKSGKRINFFIRTDSDGLVSAYFDACFTCYRHKKGYYQDSSDIVCRECEMRFGIYEKKWEEKNGCNPIYLKSSIVNGNLLIDTDMIEKGAKLF